MFARFIRRLARDQAGATAIEYGLILSLIVIAMIAAFVGLADTTNAMWSNVNTKVVRASSAP